MGLLDDAIREHLDLKRKRGSDPEEIERLEREALGPVRREPAGVQASADASVAEASRFEDDEPLYEDEFEAGPPAALQPDADSSDDDFEDDSYVDHATELHSIDEPEPPFEEEPRRRGFFGRKRAKADPEPVDEFDPLAGSRRVQAEPVGPRPTVPSEPELELHEIDPEPPPVAFEPEPPQRPRFADLPSAVPPTSAAPEAADLHAEPEQPLTHEEPPAQVAPSTPAPAAEDWSEETQLFDVPKHLEDDPDVPEAEAEAKPADEDVLEETPEFLQDTPDHDRLWFEQKPPRDFDFDG